MPAERPRILMAVFNALDFDGRVQRAAEALAGVSDLEVVAIDGGRGFGPTGPYRLNVVPAAPGEFGGNRMLHWRFLKHLVARARAMRPHVLYAHDFFLAFPGWLAARMSGARYVYDAHELIIPGALGRDHSQVQERIWYWLERAVVKHADLVIAANDSRARIMVEHYGLKAQPVGVRNITVPPENTAADREALLGQFPFLRRQSPEECLCVYQGDVDMDRGLAAVIDAFPLLGSRFRLLVIGGGPDVEVVRERGRRYAGRARIEAIGKVPRSALHGILGACDIGICVYSYNGLNNIHCSPNKVFEYAQAGLAMVATGQPPLVELVANTGIGRIAGENGPPAAAEFAAAIRQVDAALPAHRAALPAFLAANRWQDETARLQAAVSRIWQAPQ